MPIYFTSRRDGRPKRQNSSENVSTPRGEYSNPFEKPVGSGTVKVLTKGMTLNLKERVGEFNLGQELKRRVSGTLTPGHLTEHKISLPSPLHTPTCAPAYSPFSTPRLSPEPSKMGTTPPLSSAPTSQSTSTSTQVHKKSASSMEPRGQLRVRVKSANGLEVPSKERSRPYALIQYDHAESITREWGTEARDLIPRQKPGKLIPTQSGRGVTIGKRPLSAFDASNPGWDHEAVFDVLAEHRLLRVAIYDKALRASTDQHAFLGCVEFEPELNEGWNEEISLRLKSHALTDLVPGTVKLSIRFEKQKSKKKVAQEDFQILKRIGEGSFGQVYKVRKKDTKRIYAMKVISKKSVIAHKSVDHVLAERRVLQKTLDCRFLVGLKFSFQTDRELFFIMDYKSGGELFKHLQRHGGKFQESFVRFYLGQITLALEYLHNQNIIYRDLKPENCLLDASGNISLCDFGLSKPDLPVGETTRTFCGTTEYLAPEIIMEEGYDRMVDFWSLGVILYEMCFGWSPFYAEERVQKYMNILEAQIRIPTRSVSQDGRDLMTKLLTRDPKKRLGSRYGATEVKQHLFFKDMDWKGLAQGEITPPFKPSVDPDDENLDRSSVTADISESQYKSRRSSVIDSGFGGSDRRSSERNPFSKHVQGLFRGFTFARETSAENGSALLRPGLRRNSESRAADFEHKRRTLQRKGSSFDETLAHKNLPLTSSIPSFDDFDGSWGSFDDD